MNRRIVFTIATVAFAGVAATAAAEDPSVALETGTLDAIEITAGGRTWSVALPVGVPVPKAVGSPGVAPVNVPATPLPGGAAVAPGEPEVALSDYAPLLPDDTLTVRASTGSAPIFGPFLAAGGEALVPTGLATEIPDLGAEGAYGLVEGAAPGFGGAEGGDPARLAYEGAGEAPVPLDYLGSASGAGDGAPGSPRSTPVSAAAVSVDPAGGASALDKAKAVAAVTAALALPALVGWALYHRIRGHSTLENETRKQIFDMIASKPGIGVHEIAEAKGIAYSTATYHLDRLVEAHMIVMSCEANRLRYYKNGGAFNEEERKILPLLKNKEVVRLLTVLLENPGTYRAVIAEKMGVTPTTVNWHLKRLVAVGLITEVRQGRSAYLNVDAQKLARVVEPLVGKLEGAETDTAEVARQLLAATASRSAPEASPLVAA